MNLTAAARIVALSLATASCGTLPAAPSLALNPSCALVVGETAMASDVAAAWHLPPDPRLLISERRGAPAAAQWRFLGDHHQPVPLAPSTTFKWPVLLDVSETAVRTPQGYQVHVVMNTLRPPVREMVDMIQNEDGSWRNPRQINNTVQTGRPGGPLGTDIGRAGIFSRVSSASVNGRLHVCAVEAQGQIEREIFDPARDAYEGWTDIELSIGQETPGRFVDVSCAGVVEPTSGLEQLHVCAVTDDGKLWHSIEGPGRAFTPFGDVKGQSGNVGDFTRVACAGNGSQLHLVGVTSNHRAWHTTRIPTGWSPFVDVATQSQVNEQFRDVAIGFCNADVPSDGPRDVSQLNVVMTGIGSQIWHTIRATNPVSWSPSQPPTNWRPMQNLAPVINRGSTAPVPVVTTPTLWGGFSVGFRPFQPY